MSEPPVIIVDREWKSFARGRTEADYEDFVAPGAFWDYKRKRTYCSETAFVEAIFHHKPRFRKLLKHEQWGHGAAVPKHDHPTKPIPAIIHAFSVGFDDRSAGWPLRWFWHKPTMPQYEKWEREVSKEWREGRLRAMAVSDLLRQGL